MSERPAVVTLPAGRTRSSEALLNFAGAVSVAPGATRPSSAEPEGRQRGPEERLRGPKGRLRAPASCTCLPFLRSLCLQTVSCAHTREKAYL